MDRDEAASEAVNAICQGRLEGLQDLIRLYELPALRLAFSITGDRQLAEEVASEAFMRLWKAAKSYQPGLSPSSAAVLARPASAAHG